MTWSARPSWPVGHKITAAEAKAVLDQIEGLWVDWTPTLTNLTQGNGLILARYVQAGSTVHWKWRFTLGTTSAVGTSPKFTLPVTPADYSSFSMGWFDLTDTGTANRLGYARFSTGSTVEVVSYNTTGVAVSTTATVPHTWGSTDTMAGYGSYEAA